MFHHIRGPFRPQDIPVEGERNANIANDEDVGEGGISNDLEVGRIPIGLVRFGINVF